MKTMSRYMAAMVFCVGNAAHAAEPFAGSWELVSAKYVKQNGEVLDEDAAKKLKSLKILSKNRFTFITQAKDGKFVSAGGGTYRIEGKQYIESLEYASDPKMLGKAYSFSYRVSNGRWVHKGMEDGVHIEEIWRRVD